jgi:hypothetical protein
MVKQKNYLQIMVDNLPKFYSALFPISVDCLNTLPPSISQATSTTLTEYN